MIVRASLPLSHLHQLILKAGSCFLCALMGTATLTAASSPALELDSSATTFVRNNIQLRAIHPLSDGSFLVGGDFDSIGGVRVSHLARILPDGTVDPSFAVQPSGVVLAMDSDSLGRVVIGGNFQTINGISSPYLGRLNADLSFDSAFTSGLGTSTNAQVRAIELDSNDDILIGGTFSTFNGSSAEGLIKLDSSGLPVAGFSSPPFDSFTSVNDLSVDSLDRIAISGSFQGIGGASRNRIARLLSDGTLDTTFDPGAGSQRAPSSILALPDGKILLGGNLNKYDNTNVNRLIRINSDGSLDGTLVGFPNERVYCLELLSGDRIGVGGQFDSYNDGTQSIAVPGVAVLASDGTLEAQQAQLTWSIESIQTPQVRAVGELPNLTRIAGGTFETSAPSFSRGLFSFATSGTASDTWSLGNRAEIRVLLEGSGGSVYAGGNFTHVNDLFRPGLVKLNDTGAPDPSFVPDLGSDPTIRSLVLHDGSLLAAGRLNISSPGTHRIAVRLATADGQLDPTFVVPTSGTGVGTANTIAVLEDDTIMLGGTNLLVHDNAADYRNLLQISSTGSVLTEWTLLTGPDSEINALATMPDGGILAGGTFTQWATDSRIKRIARLDSDFSLDLDYSVQSDPNSVVQDLAVRSDGRAVIVGNFSKLDGDDLVSERVAGLASSGGLDSSFNPPNIDRSVQCVTLDDSGRVILGGTFFDLDGSSVPGVIRLEPDGTLDQQVFVGTTWEISTVYDVLPVGHTVKLGGSFETIATQTRLGWASFAPPAGAPEIDSEPLDQNIATGGTAVFSVSATSATPLTYQWQRNGVDLSGETNTTLTLTDVQSVDSGYYRVIVCNDSGTTISRTVELRLDTFPAITSQPTDTSAEEFTGFSFSVTATGPPPLTYQWYQGLSGDRTLPLNGETGSTFSGTAGSPGSKSYWVEVINPFGVAESNTVTLTTVEAPPPPTPPSIITGLTDIAVNSGDQATFTVVADGSGILSYSWFLDGSPLSETGSSLTIFNATSGLSGRYKVEVRSSDFPSTTFDESDAELTVRTLPEFTQQPASQSVAAGSDVNFEAFAEGPGPITYQWQKNGSNVPGANAGTLALTSVTTGNAGDYRLRATNSFGTTVSATATLSISTPPAVSTIPGITYVRRGENTSLQVEASGTAPLTFQWYQGISGDTSMPVGVGGSTFATPDLSTSTNYWVRVTNAFGSDDSSTFEIAVGDPPTASVSPSSLSLNELQSGSFSAVVGGTGPFTYQWRKDDTDIPGQIGSAINLSSVDADNAGDYSVRVSSEYGTLTSQAATLSVTLIPRITAQPTNTSTVLGSSASFSVTATGTPPLTYQWFLNGGPVPDSNTPDLTILDTSLEDAGEYTVTVTNAAGSDTSQGRTLTVNSPPSITVQPEATQNVPTGSTATLSVVAEGTAPLNYQWYSGAAPDTSNPVATGASFETPALVSNASYWVAVSNTFGSINSITANMIVGSPPVITTQPVGGDFEVGDAILLEISYTGNNPITFEWLSGGTALENETADQLLINPAGLGDSGSYQVRLTNDFGEAVSDPASVSVSERMAPVVSAESGGGVVAPGDPATFSVNASGSNPLTLQWFKDGQAIPGANEEEYQIAAAFASDSGDYFCRVSNDVGTVDSDPITLAVVTPPTIDFIGEDPIATGDNAIIRSGVTGQEPFTYQWFEGSLGDETQPVGGNSDTLPTAPLLADTTYWLRVSNASGQDEAEFTVTVLDPVVITSQPAAQTVSSGGNASFTVVASGGGTLSYAWRFNGEVIDPMSRPSADNDELSFVALFKDSGTYTVTVTNEVSEVTSSAAVLTVETEPSFISPLSDATFSAGTYVLLSVVADGSPTLTYQWYLDEVLIPGAQASSLDLGAIGVTDAGEYKVIVENAFGTAESVANIVVEGAPEISSINGPEEVPFGGTAVLTSAVVGPGPIQYFWFQGDPGDTTTPVGGNQSNLTTPPLTQTTKFWLRATNTFGSADSEGLEIIVEPPVPVIQSASSASGSVGSLFSYQIVATNSPTTFTADPLPAGLELDTTRGVIVGIPEEEGVTNITLTAANATHQGEATLQLTVLPARAVHVGLQTMSAPAGSAASLHLNLSGLADEITFINLPPWLIFDEANQRLTGTPPNPGEYEFQMLLTNGGGVTLQNLRVSASPAAAAPAITSADFVAGTEGDALSHTIMTSPAATSLVLTGDLPTGLSWDPGTGALSGTPSNFGEFSLEITPTNAAGQGNPQSLTLEIEPMAGRPVVTNLGLARGYAGELFERVLTATDNPTSFEVDNLPAGLGLSQDGSSGDWIIGGNPALLGETIIRVRAVNAVGAGEWKDILLQIRAGRLTPVMSSAARADGRLTLPFNFQLTATENPTSFAADGLPDGLTLNPASGEITGVPLVAGTHPVSITPTNLDGPGSPFTMWLFIDVEPGAPVIGTEPVFIARQGSRYHAPIVSTESPIRFTALAGSEPDPGLDPSTLLPPGISLSEATGIIGGIPTQKGVFRFVLEAESSFGFVSAPTTLTMIVQGPVGTPSLVSETDLEATVDEEFEHTLAADAEVTEVDLGPLPPGLIFDLGTGSISGTPTQAGSFEVPITLANDRGAGLPTNLTFSVSAGSATPRIVNLAAAEFEYAVSAQLQLEAINGPITAWRVNEGSSLPPGMELNPATGLISGRPIRVGSFRGLLSAANSNGFGDAQEVLFIVAADPALPIVTSPRLPETAYTDQRWAYQIEATNMPSTRPLPSGYRFHASNLPAGLALQPATGLIEGIPLASGTLEFSVWGENLDGEGEPVTIKLNVLAFDLAFALRGPGSASGEVNREMSVQLVANSAIASSWIDLSPDDGFGSQSLPNGLLESIPPRATGDMVRFRPQQTGNHRIRFGAEGISGSQDWIDTLVQVLPGEESPVITSPSDIYVAAGDQISHQITATNPSSGDPPTLGFFSSMPEGVWSWSWSTPNHIIGSINIPGTYSFRVAARNEFGYGLPQDIRIFVAPREGAGTITSVSSAPAASNSTKKGREPSNEKGDTGVRRNPPAPSPEPSSGELAVSGTRGEFLSVTLNPGTGVTEFRAENLPTGLILNPTSGIIAGVPTSAGTFSSSVSARNDEGWGAPLLLTFNIGAPPGTPVINSHATVEIVAGSSFSYSITSSPAALAYNLDSDCPELAIDGETSTLTGSLDQPGVYLVGLSGINESGEGAPMTLTITVTPEAGTPVISDPGLIQLRQGEAADFDLGSTPAATSWFTEGLPYGLSLDPDTGKIAGTPLEQGASEHRVWASNASGPGDALTLQFEILPSLQAPVITSTDSFAVRAGETIDFQLTADGNPASFNAGALPSGLTLDPQTGLLAGSMPEAGEYALSFGANNEFGAGPNQSFTLTILPGLQSFEEWASVLPEGQRGPDDDPFGHRVPNLIKFVLGIAPESPDRSHLPRFREAGVGDQTYPALEFTRSTEVLPLQFILEAGPSLSELSPVPAVLEVLGSPSSGLETVLLRQTTLPTSETRWFLRLRVTE